MEIFPVWRDLFFEYQGDVLEYRITIKDGDEIFHGRAVKSPKDRVIRIRLNDCCESYLNSLLGEEAFREAESIDRAFPLDAYGEFALDVIDGDSWETAYEWAFTNDYSYDYKEPHGSYSEPINGHSATGQLLPYSHLVTGDTESVCYDGCGGIYFTITSGVAVEYGWGGGYWRVRWDTNLDSVYYVCSDGTTGTSSNGRLNKTLPRNYNFFKQQYTVRFYDRQGGTLLGTAVATVDAVPDADPDPAARTFTIISYPSVITNETTAVTVEYSISDNESVYFHLYSSTTQGSGYQEYDAYSVSRNAGVNTETFTIPANMGTNPVYYRISLGIMGLNIQYADIKQLGAQLDNLYLTFDIISGGTIFLSGVTSANIGVIRETVMYLRDTDNDWQVLPRQTGITVNAGEKIFFKATGRANSTYLSTFEGTTAYYNVYGNIMSLLYGDNFVGQTDNAKQGMFLDLFKGTNVVSAAGLVLPATELHNECYENMFVNCTSLVSAPSVLPATSLTYSCYAGMFYGCTSLVNAPVILGTALQPRCCEMMFRGCTSLVNAPALPATDMQYGDYCYMEMFSGCTSLVNAPELLGTQNLQQYCYTFMFAGCSSLSYLKCLAPRTAAQTAHTTTQDWLKDVSPTGTFVKAPDAVWPTGRYGVPSGWTVVDA